MLAFFNSYRRPLVIIFRSIGIIIVVSGFILAFSFIVSYFLYYWLAPLKGVTLPVYLRQSDSGLFQEASVDILSHQSEWNPSANAVKLVRQNRVLSAGYRYSIALIFTMPQTLINQAESSSSISLDLIADDGTYLGSSFRSLSTSQQSYIHYSFKSVFWWPLVVFGLYNDDQNYQVFMSTSFIERRLFPLSHINITVNYHIVDAVKIKRTVLDIDRYNRNYLIDYPILFVSISTLVIFSSTSLIVLCGLVFAYTDDRDSANQNTATHGAIATRIADNAAEEKTEDNDYDSDEFQDSWDGIMEDDSKG